MITCTCCNWVGIESECDVITDTESFEFWGCRDTRIVEYNVCPACGSENLTDYEEHEDYTDDEEAI